MGGKKKGRKAPSATPWDGIPDGELAPSQLIVRDAHRAAYGFRHAPFAGDAGFINSYERDERPFCAGRPVRFGFDGAGIRRWRCAGCGRTFTPATGTMLDNRKVAVAAMAGFLIQVLSFESMNALTREQRRADTATPYWRAKLFAAVEGIQDGAVLAGRAQIDETYWPVAAKDLFRREDGSLPSGLSRNLHCIAVGCSESGGSFFVSAGLGKPSAERAWQAYGRRIAPGSVLVHDKERSHRKLVAGLGLVSESHDSRILAGLPDEENPLERVDHLCFPLKAFPRAHAGFDRSDLQGYLDVFSVMMNPPESKMEKAATVLDRAMLFPKPLRFREYYKRKG